MCRVGSITSILGRMVKLGRSVFYLFGHMVKNSAIRFCTYSAVWIQPYVQVRFLGQESDLATLLVSRLH